MEFPFDLTQVFRHDLVQIGSDMLPVGGLPPGSPFGNKNLGLVQQRVMEIIDAMGEASAAAQQLKQPITSGVKARNQPEHTIFLLVDGQCVLGLLKVGRKNLFLLDRQGDQNEVYPHCVLDFYVHESRQRSGCGRRLFEFMLERRGDLNPRHMAVDRPSPKLLAFLRKYYGLANAVPQVNNYVIFEGFFNNGDIYCSPQQPKKPRIYMGRLQYV